MIVLPPFGSGVSSVLLSHLVLCCEQNSNFFKILPTKLVRTLVHLSKDSGLLTLYINLQLDRYGSKLDLLNHLKSKLTWLSRFHCVLSCGLFIRRDIYYDFLSPELSPGTRSIILSQHYSSMQSHNCLMYHGADFLILFSTR